MSRKDYVVIAEVIADQRQRAGAAECWRLDETARALADAMRAANPRFDRARFLTACGVEVKR